MPRKRKEKQTPLGRPKKFNPITNIKRRNIKTNATVMEPKNISLTYTPPTLVSPVPTTPDVINIEVNSPQITPDTCIEKKVSKELNSLLYSGPRVRTPKPKWHFGNRLIHVESLKNNIEC